MPRVPLRAFGWLVTYALPLLAGKRPSVPQTSGCSCRTRRRATNGTASSRLGGRSASILRRHAGRDCRVFVLGSDGERRGRRISSRRSHIPLQPGHPQRPPCPAFPGSSQSSGQHAGRTAASTRLCANGTEQIRVLTEFVARQDRWGLEAATEADQRKQSEKAEENPSRRQPHHPRVQDQACGPDRKTEGGRIIAGNKDATADAKEFGRNAIADKLQVGRTLVGKSPAWIAIATELNLPRKSTGRQIDRRKKLDFDIAMK